MNFAVGWRQVATIFFMLALASGIVFSSYGIISAPIGKEFHATHTMTMMGMGAILLFGVVMSPIIGGWMDRFPFQVLTTAAAVLLASGLFALSFVQTMWHVIAVYAVFMTIPISVCGPMGASVLIMRWFVKRRGLAMGIAIAGLSAGSFVFPVVVQQVIEVLDWRMALRILALFVALTMIPAGLFLIVSRPEDRGLHPDGASEPPPEQPSTRTKGKPVSIREVVGDLNFWLVAFSLGIPMSSGTGTTSNIVLFAGDLGIQAKIAALAMSTIAVSSASGKLMFAFVGDRFDIRLIQFTSMVLSTAGLLTLASAASVPGLFAGGALFSFGSGLLNPLWGVLIARTFDRAVVGKAMGLVMSIAMVLSVISPVLFAKLRDVTGSYATPFIFYGVAILLSTALLPKIKLRSA
ncbi:Cyanate permease [Novosphingobium sp. CF614]|uniref:MFS transporter n=1 Tax=Novosphingobium sp. CF614 TaxID=1884364 RepID=UPI0008DECCAD|nr:MFS transporter [Novosphingobium sp. CF614]SFF77504.1 Cyanate permease [Novosphingobium sp. CF614]